MRRHAACVNKCIACCQFTKISTYRNDGESTIISCCATRAIPANISEWHGVLVCDVCMFGTKTSDSMTFVSRQTHTNIVGRLFSLGHKIRLSIGMMLVSVVTKRSALYSIS